MTRVARKTTTGDSAAMLLLPLVLLAAPAIDLGPLAIPANGAVDVVRNPLILVPDPFAAVVLVGEGSVVVETTTTSLTDANFNSTLRVLPAERLVASTRYVLHTTDETGTFLQELTSFTTGADVDEDAPDAPDVSVDVSGERGVVVASGDDVVAVEIVQDGRSRSLARANQEFSFFIPGESSTLTVVAFDDAGNTSEPTEVQAERNGLGGVGCAAAPPLPALAALVALGALRRRRR